MSGLVEINPTAMAATADHVFAGTLGKGLMVHDLRGGQWRAITAGLPSLNVTAVAASGGYIYVGTDNGLVRIREASL
jgi:ligand-binding sensor domain-containing protein